MIKNVLASLALATLLATAAGAAPKAPRHYAAKAKVACCKMACCDAPCWASTTVKAVRLAAKPQVAAKAKSGACCGMPCCDGGACCASATSGK